MSTKCNILPIVYPPINGFSHQGALFSILLAREECKPWIFSNFIQTYSLKDLYKNTSRSGTVDFFYNIYGDWKYFHYKANPWIRFSSIPLDYLQLLKFDAVDFLKICIDRNMYVTFDIDTFYISTYEFYQNTHEKHEIFIYGYDDEMKMFYVGDNMKNGKYCQELVPYDEINDGISQMYEFDKKNNLFWREKQISMLEVTQNTEASGKDPLFIQEILGLNIKKIVNDIKEYLLIDKYSSGYSYSNFYVFGIECYDELIKYAIYAKETEVSADIRGFYSFYMHKKLMLLRLEFLNNDYELSEIIKEYDILVRKFDVLILLLVKAKMKKENRLLEKVAEILKDSKEYEVHLLNNLIKCLDN